MHSLFKYLIVLEVITVVWVKASRSHEPEIHVNANLEGKAPIHPKKKVQEDLSSSGEGGHPKGKIASCF